MNLDITQIDKDIRTAFSRIDELRPVIKYTMIEIQDYTSKITAHYESIILSYKRIKKVKS